MTMRLSVFVYVLAALSATGCALHAPSLSVPSGALLATKEDGQYRIGPEDVLAIGFDRDDPTTFTSVVVRPDGRISLPRLGDVKVGNSTPTEVRSLLEHVGEASAWVSVTQTVSQRFFVVGQVAKPGSYPLLGPLSVLQALAIAGGPGEWAKTGKVFIARTDGSEHYRYIRFDFKRLERREAAIELMLSPGDVVVAP